MLGNKDKSYQFVIVTEESRPNLTSLVLMDNETGVQYLYIWRPSAAGVTLLVDADGRPIINEKWKQEHGQ